MEKRLQEIKENYLQKAKEFFGEVPKHCHSTRIVIASSPTDKFSSGADCKNNIIYLHPDVISKNKDIEWVIFHEMEHIRLARDFGNDQCTGFYLDYEYGTGEALNEGVTDIATTFLLSRKQFGSCAYDETIALTRQIFALLGKDDREITKYCTLSGRRKFIDDFEEIAGVDVFPLLETSLQNVHDSHIQDILKEYEKYGKILSKPLGKFHSEKTQRARETFKNLVLPTVVKFIKKKGMVSCEELNDRMKKMEELSPYKTKEVSLPQK